MATQVHRWRHNWVWQYFKKLDKLLAKCNFCEQSLQYQRNLHYLKVHLSLVHGISVAENKLIWEDKSVLLWQYFIENENRTEATCKCCGLVIVKEQRNLQQHLQHLHSNVIDEICEEIRCTWVSQHFTFDMRKCDIKCIHCDWSFKIFDNIDGLKFHLFQCHKINENSGNNNGINDDNRNIMTQQSVAEENYASTSSHHDNRYEQDAGNQTVQQIIFNHYFNYETTRTRIPVSSEDDNHDTASAIWQPWK